MHQIEPIASITATIPKESDEKREIHSVPCKFDYTGPAKVASYFYRDTCPETMKLQASLRGRGLEGASISTPEGYEFVVLKPRIEQGNHYDIEQTSDSIYAWEWDRSVGERTALNKAFAYLPIAEALAADD